MTTLTVGLGERSYPIHLVDALPAATVAAEAERVRGRQGRALIVTDSNVGPLYAADLRQALESVGLQVVLVELPAGEELSVSLEHILMEAARVQDELVTLVNNQVIRKVRSKNKKAKTSRVGLEGLTPELLATNKLITPTEQADLSARYPDLSALDAAQQQAYLTEIARLSLGLRGPALDNMPRYHVSLDIISTEFPVTIATPGLDRLLSFPTR